MARPSPPPTLRAVPADADDGGITSAIRHQAVEAPGRRLGGQPWWETLDADFHRHRDRFRLSLGQRLRVGTTAAIDVAIRTGGASLVGALAVPLGYNPGRFREMLRSRELYQPLADAGDPERFFVPPPPGVRVRRDPPWRPTFRPRDGVCEDLTFMSPFRPHNPELVRDYVRHKANLVAHARYWRHSDGPRPTIVMIHGFGADAYWLNEWMFELRWFYEKLGCDVLLFTLPFHGPRQTRYSPFSGHGFFAGGLSRINEAFAQAVHDFRIFLRFLTEEIGAEQVGVTGISLGGFTTALLAAVEPSLRFAIPNVPVTSIGDLILEWHPVGEFTRVAMRATGLSVVDLRHALAVSSPLTYAPALPRERLMIIGGVADRLAPPKQARILWEHWDRCRLHWFPGSHVLHLDKHGYLKEVAKFLSAIDFLPPRPPT